MKVKAIIFLSALIILILVIDNLEKIDSIRKSEIASKQNVDNDKIEINFYSFFYTIVIIFLINRFYL